MSAVPEQKYLVAGSGGYGFIAAVEDMVSRVKAGKAFMTLEEDEEPLRRWPWPLSITSPRCPPRDGCSSFR